MTTLIPESAPFNEEQRAWLNGFLAGYMGVGASAAEASGAAALMAGGVPALPGEAASVASDVEEDLSDAPWHDSGLQIEERMKLAEGKPLPHRMMAAMAQLDCGSCGYVCESYSRAIASGEETNITLCSPGGKETKQALKVLVKEIGVPTNGNGANGNGAINKGANGTSTNGNQSDAAVEYSRKNPFQATLLASRKLNLEGSAKDTRHVEIDLAGSGLKYDVGDALGVCPVNCNDLVKQVLGRLGADPEMTVNCPAGKSESLGTALSASCCLKEPSDELLELIIERSTDTAVLKQLGTYLDEGVPDGFDVLDCLEADPAARLSATEFVETLSPLNPRLYSIASSQRAVGDQVHLTIGKVVYERDGRTRKGVASCMLGGDAENGAPVNVFVQPNHGGFTVPASAETSMIMIGPGTGIAPFMAFLQERAATDAPGKNWLFFGDQREQTDFLYRDQLVEYQSKGLLTNLSTAFSRDGDAKVYVQDRMLESAADLWKWIEEGAHVYVCGDASRMAADVHKTLIQVAATQGGMSTEEATEFIDTLAKAQRYVRDVY
ncbi:MAG: sulfite reductase subunit alpha [Aureliella sp.]